MKRNETERTAREVASECIAVRLRLLNRVITSLYDYALRPLDLKVSQMNLLVAAASLGVARPAEVCEALQMGPSTLSRNVERMRARGWLEGVPEPDGRTQPFRLTKEGERVLREARPAWEEAQAKARDLLGEEAVASLDAAARRIGRLEVP